MDALLTAAEVAHVPLIVLLGSPQYYSQGSRAAEKPRSASTCRPPRATPFPSSRSRRKPRAGRSGTVATVALLAVTRSGLRLRFAVEDERG
jgi:predicted N-acetyltransferase YhbS